MPDWDWTVLTLLIYGVWLFCPWKHDSEPWWNGETCCLPWRKSLKNKREVCLDNVDLVPSNVRFSNQEALLYVFEDNEAVIKMIIKGRSPTMRHVSRTERVAPDWLFDRINLDPKIQIKYIDTKNQLADISHVTSRIIFCVCLTLAISVLPIVLKWCRKELTKESGEESHSEVKTNDEFDCAKQWKGSINAIIYCITKPGENQTRKPKSSEPANWEVR